MKPGISGSYGGRVPAAGDASAETGHPGDKAGIERVAGRRTVAGVDDAPGAVDDGRRPPLWKPLGLEEPPEILGILCQDDGVRRSGELLRQRQRDVEHPLAARLAEKDVRRLGPARLDRRVERRLIRCLVERRSEIDARIDQLLPVSAQNEQVQGVRIERCAGPFLETPQVACLEFRCIGQQLQGGCHCVQLPVDGHGQRLCVARRATLQRLAVFCPELHEKNGDKGEDRQSDRYDHGDQIEPYRSPRHFRNFQPHFRIRQPVSPGSIPPVQVSVNEADVNSSKPGSATERPKTRSPTSSAIRDGKGARTPPGFRAPHRRRTICRSRYSHRRRRSRYGYPYGGRPRPRGADSGH